MGLVRTLVRTKNSIFHRRASVFSWRIQECSVESREKNRLAHLRLGRGEHCSRRSYLRGSCHVLGRRLPCALAAYPETLVCTFPHHGAHVPCHLQRMWAEAKSTYIAQYVPLEHNQHTVVTSEHITTSLYYDHKDVSDQGQS